MQRESYEPTFAYDNNGLQLGPGDHAAAPAGIPQNRDPGADTKYPFGRNTARRGMQGQLGRVGRVLVPLSILMIEFFERMANTMIVSGIYKYSVLTLNYNALDSALTLSTLVASMAYVMAPLGGKIADSLLGRFGAIIVFTIQYILGLALFIWMSINPASVNFTPFNVGTTNLIALLGLLLISFGAGGIKANAAPFGADQIASLGEKSVTSYFHWYYLVLNLGCVAGTLLVSLFPSEEYIGTWLLVPLGGIALSLIIFGSLKSTYVKFKPDGKCSNGFCGICCQACCKRSPDKDIMFSRAMQTYGGDTPDHLVIGFGSFFRASHFHIFLMIAWFGIALSTNTLPSYQADRMSYALGGALIPSWVSDLFYYLAIVTIIPAIPLGILPLFRACKKRLLPLKRLGLGILLVALGLALAGGIEMSRKSVMESGGFTVVEQSLDPDVLEEVMAMAEADMQQAGDSDVTNGTLVSYINQLAADPPDGFPLWELQLTINVSSLSVLSQLPNYFLIGAGETFATVAGLELAYDQAPFSYQGLLTGIFVMVIGGGQLMAGSLLSNVEEYTQGLSTGAWFSVSSVDINELHMEYLLFAGAAAILLIFFIFLLVSACCYSYTEPMSFTAVEGSEIPGMEMKPAADSVLVRESAASVVTMPPRFYPQLQ